MSEWTCVPSCSRSKKKNKNKKVRGREGEIRTSRLGYFLTLILQKPNGNALISFKSRFISSPNLNITFREGKSKTVGRNEGMGKRLS